MNDFYKTILSPGSDDERNWIAFQYVTGELSDAERDAFEERLLDDLAACEAVAAMSELCQQYQHATDVEPASSIHHTPTPTVFSRLRSWVAVASTLAAVVWLFVLLDGTETPSVSSINPTETEDAAGLIAGWANSEPEETLPEDSLYKLNEVDFNDGSAPEIPGWMIAAVSLENAEREMEEMMDEPVEMKEN